MGAFFISMLLMGALLVVGVIINLFIRPRRMKRAIKRGRHTAHLHDALFSQESQDEDGMPLTSK